MEKYLNINNANNIQDIKYIMEKINNVKDKDEDTILDLKIELIESSLNRELTDEEVFNYFTFNYILTENTI